MLHEPHLISIYDLTKYIYIRHAAEAKLSYELVKKLPRLQL